MHQISDIMEIHVPPRMSAMTPYALCTCVSRLPLRPGYDFHKDGPPLKTCAKCNEGFREWDASPNDLRRIPRKLLTPDLCLADFRRLVKEAGHNPASMQFDDRLWKSRLAEWETTREEPLDRVHLRLPDDNQVVWCKPVAEDNGSLVVSLESYRVFKAPFPGALFSARWDGRTVSGCSGRPVLEPIRRLHDLGDTDSKRPIRMPWVKEAVPTGVN